MPERARRPAVEAGGAGRPGDGRPGDAAGAQVLPARTAHRSHTPLFLLLGPRQAAAGPVSLSRGSRVAHSGRGALDTSADRIR